MSSKGYNKIFAYVMRYEYLSNFLFFFIYINSSPPTLFAYGSWSKRWLITHLAVTSLVRCGMRQYRWRDNYIFLYNQFGCIFLQLFCVSNIVINISFNITHGYMFIVMSEIYDDMQSRTLLLVLCIYAYVLILIGQVSLELHNYHLCRWIGISSPCQ